VAFESTAWVRPRRLLRLDARSRGGNNFRLTVRAIGGTLPAEGLMRSRSLERRRSGHTAGIILLILSLVHTPLPQLDFHNIRHHDKAGEVCEHHDHLLRWHPDAGLARDVAVLHWHWFLPSIDGSDPLPQGSGVAVHAHTSDWQAAAWDDGPRVTADTASARLVLRLAFHPVELSQGLTLPGILVTAPPGGRPPLAFGATFAPGVSLTSLLHRWNC